MASFYTDNRQATTPAQTNVAATPKTMTAFYSPGTTGRGQMFECEVGADGAPNATDCQIVYSFDRITTQGTGGVASVFIAINPADTAVARTLARINETAEGTLTANTTCLRMALNQRASQRWIAAPGKELVYPNTANAGFAGRALSPTYAAPVLISVFIDDL